MHEKRLSNQELLSSLTAALKEEGHLIARVVSMLIEVEDRRIHLEHACSSLFLFCTQRLGMSASSAYRRSVAASLARRFPRVLEEIRARRLFLSSLVVVRNVITEENVDSLLTRMAGKSQREVEELLVTIAPRAGVKPSIRKLPEPKPTSLSVMGEPLPAAPSNSNTKGDAPAAPAAPAPAANTTAQTYQPVAARATPPARQLVPLGEARHMVRFTASSALRKKLERAQSLMRHRNVNGDIAVVVERAMDLLILELEKQKLAAVKRPKSKAQSPAPATAESAVPASHDTGTISAAARREVIARDAEQCSFVSPTGDRCSARDFLEIDHRHPRALGGGNEPANLRLLCRAHNQYAAERIFGRDHVARAIDVRRRKKTSAEEQSRLPLT